MARKAGSGRRTGVAGSLYGYSGPRVASGAPPRTSGISHTQTFRPAAPAPTYQGSTYSGPSSSGGGGGGYDPANDPTYHAYIRSLDLEAAQRQQDAARRKEYLTADRDALLSETARTGELDRENIDAGMEDRGLFLSGARLRDRGRQQGNQLAREGRIRTDTGRAVSETEEELAQAMAKIYIRRLAANQGIFD